ncbi:ATP-binding protein [Actinoplanes awajinensis]|uniref:ATP-binding protein n=1 Tax=Actinoplanes awajinensis TaxID=135946 RepID=UPI0012FC8E6F|nr:ATP-binding protein [Actinoplanes awajinensis]
MALLVALAIRYGWWGAYFGDPDHGAWPWIERLGWLIGIVFTPLGVFYAAASLRQAIEQAQRPATPPVLPRDPSLLDRDSTFASLRRRLIDGPWGVIAVTGPPGIGKSRLVEVTVAHVEKELGDVRVCATHTIEPQGRLDVRELIADVTNDRFGPVVLETGQTLSGQLRAALEASENRRIVIVIDSADNLCLPGGPRHLDFPLDEAMETFATEPGHRVAVILVSRRPMEARGYGIWPDMEPPIGVGRLPQDAFAQWLARLNVDGRLRLDEVSDADQVTLYRQLRGNPHCARLVAATITHAVRQVSLTDLVRTIGKTDLRRVPQTLADLLTRSISPQRRDILAALAVLDTPVDMAGLMAVLAGTPDEGMVRADLAALESSALVRATEDQQYYLTVADPGWLLPRDDGFLRRAAELMKHRQNESMQQRQGGEPHTIDQLRPAFVRVRLLLDSGRHTVAYEVIEKLSDRLSDMNAKFLLLAQRERIRGQTGEPFLEMANENELGDIYGDLGRFDDAHRSYGIALKLAESFDPLLRRRILANQANLYLKKNQAQAAYNSYEFVRAHAGPGEAALKAAALFGLARCHRHWGQYTQAFARADEALTVAGDSSPERSAWILAELVGWQLDVGQVSQAETTLADLLRLAPDSDHRWTRNILDLQAEIALAHGDTGKARDLATDAAERAVQAGDPRAIVAACLTLGQAQLRIGDLDEALRHIEHADRYRGRGQQLMVLALRAVVTQLMLLPSAAGPLFKALFEEASDRIREDGQDFGSYAMRGLARCGLLLDAVVAHDQVSFDPDVLQPATDDFTAAEQHSQRRAKGRRDRVLALLRHLNDQAEGSLRPVMEPMLTTPPRTTS